MYCNICNILDIYQVVNGFFKIPPNFSRFKKFSFINMQFETFSNLEGLLTLWTNII